MFPREKGSRPKASLDGGKRKALEDGVRGERGTLRREKKKWTALSAWRGARGPSEAAPQKMRKKRGEFEPKGNRC